MWSLISDINPSLLSTKRESSSERNFLLALRLFYLSCLPIFWYSRFLCSAVPSPSTGENELLRKEEPLKSFFVFPSKRTCQCKAIVCRRRRRRHFHRFAPPAVALTVGPLLAQSGSGQSRSPLSVFVSSQLPRRTKNDVDRNTLDVFSPTRQPQKKHSFNVHSNPWKVTPIATPTERKWQCRSVISLLFFISSATSHSIETFRLVCW